MGTHPPRILTIGSSCINRFQFDFFQKRHPETAGSFVKSLFDWNIVSLVGTESLLRRAADQQLLSVLQDTSQFFVEWDVLLFNKQLPGVCFFHEQEIAKTFDDQAQKDLLIRKLTHHAAPFLTPDYPGRTHLVWSNIQPNLPDTVHGVTDWTTFQLTPERHFEVRSLGRAVFGETTTFSFLSHADDVSPDLINEDDVQVVDLPRGDTYLGAPDLYETLLLDIVLQPHH